MKRFTLIAIAALALLISSWMVKPIRSEPLSRGPTHRYSFTEKSTNDANGMIFADSIGTANGTVRGLGARFLNERLVLPGGDPDTMAYGDLPNGLLSANSTNNGGTGEISIEGWVKVTGNQLWSRFFDFGSTGSPGHPSSKITGPGNSGQGLDYLMYAAQLGKDVNARRLELRDEDPLGGGVRTEDTFVPDSFNTDRHIVVTWKERTGEIKAYDNGKLVGSMIAGCAMSEINDLDVWLGRSQWHDDMNLQGEIDEFRIYDHVLTAGEIKFNEMKGPDKLIVRPRSN